VSVNKVEQGLFASDSAGQPRARTQFTEAGVWINVNLCRCFGHVAYQFGRGLSSSAIRYAKSKLAGNNVCRGHRLEKSVSRK